MTTRSRGPLAGFGWLKRGINVGYGNPKALLGGAGLLTLLCLLPTLITLPMQWGAMNAGTQPDPKTFVLVVVVSAIGGLLLIPIYAGYLQLVDAAERGQPARARDIFKPYRQGDALRLIGYGLAMGVVYTAAFGVVLATTGRAVAGWYWEAVTAQASHQPPPTTLPENFGITLALCVVIGMFMMGVYAISLGQVALRGRSVFAAIGDGVVGALKNLLPLLVFMASLLVAGIAVAIALVLLAGLLAVLGKLVGVWLVMLLFIPLYIALLLMVFAVGFGAMYHLWRDVCGDQGMPTMAPSVAA